MADPGERKATLWTLHIRPDDSVELYVACLLGEAFGSQETSMSESFPVEKMDPRERASARDLYTETLRFFPAPPTPRRVRGVELRSASILHLTHSLDWPNQPAGSRLVLAREVVEGPDG